MGTPNHRSIAWSLLAMAGLIVVANALGATFVSVFLLTMLSLVIAFGMAIYAVGFTNLRTSLLAFFTLSVLLSVVSTRWPSAARFQLSRYQFEQLEQQIKAGNVPTAPCWIGTYRIKESQTKGSAVCFWTCLDSSGRTGVVRNFDSPPYPNISIQQDFGDGWHLISED